MTARKKVAKKKAPRHAGKSKLMLGDTGAVLRKRAPARKRIHTAGDALKAPFPNNLEKRPARKRPARNPLNPMSWDDLAVEKAKRPVRGLAAALEAKEQRKRDRELVKALRAPAGELEAVAESTFSWCRGCEQPDECPRMAPLERPCEIAALETYGPAITAVPGEELMRAHEDLARAHQRILELERSTATSVELQKNAERREFNLAELVVTIRQSEAKLQRTVKRLRLQVKVCMRMVETLVEVPE